MSQDYQPSERELLIMSQQIQDRRSGRDPDPIVTESASIYKGSAIWSECFNRIHNMIFDDLSEAMNAVGLEHKRTDSEIIVEFSNGSKGEIIFAGDRYRARLTTKEGVTRFDGEVNSKSDFIEKVLHLY